MSTKVTSPSLMPDKKGKGNKKPVSAKKIKDSLAALKNELNVEPIEKQKSKNSFVNIKADKSVLSSDLKSVKTVDQSKLTQSILTQSKKNSKSSKIKRALGVSLGALGLASAIVVPLVVYDRNRDIMVQIQPRGNGKEVYPATIRKGSKVKDLVEVEFENYVFRGYYADEACTIPLDEDMEVKADTTIFAKYVQVHKLTLIINGVPTEGIGCCDDESLAEAIDAESLFANKGNFVGYYEDAEFTTLIDENTAFKNLGISEDAPIYVRYAEEYTISFNSFGMIQQIKAYSDETYAKAISGLTLAENYKIKWYYDAEFKNEVNPNQKISENGLYLFARYASTNSLTIKASDGSEIKTVEVYEDESISEALTREGVIIDNLVGYYTDSSFKNQISITNYRIAESTTLYARVAHTFNLMVHFPDESESEFTAYSDETMSDVVARANIDLPSNFIGWYIDESKSDGNEVTGLFSEEFSDEFESSTELSVNVYMRCADLYTVYFWKNDIEFTPVTIYSDRKLSTITQDEWNKLQKLEHTTEHGTTPSYTFINWYENSNYENVVNKDSFPTKDLSIYGKFIRTEEGQVAVTINFDNGVTKSNQTYTPYAGEITYKELLLEKDISLDLYDFFTNADCGEKITLTEKIKEKKDEDGNPIVISIFAAEKTKLIVNIVEHGDLKPEVVLDCYKHETFNSIHGKLQAEGKTLSYNLFSDSKFEESITAETQIAETSTIYAMHRVNHTITVVRVDHNGNEISDAIVKTDALSDGTLLSELERLGISTDYKTDEYVFRSWNIDLSQKLSADIEIKATYATYRNITINRPGEEHDETIKALDDETLEQAFAKESVKTELAGYVFRSWNTDLTQEPSGNMTVTPAYAKIYYITINGAEPIQALSDETLEQAFANASVVSEKEGYVFRKWHFNSVDGEVVDLTQQPTEDLVIVGEYAEKFELTINKNGTEKTIVALSDETLEQALANDNFVVDVEDHIFRKWHLNSIDGDVVNLADKPTSNMTIVGEYAEIFDITINGAEPIQALSDETLEQAFANASVISEKEGYVFRKWHFNTVDGEVVDLTQQPTEDLVIVGEYAEKFELTINKNGTEQTIISLSDETLEQALANAGFETKIDGYVFRNWHLSRIDGEVIILNELYPSADLTIYGEYAKIITLTIKLDYGTTTLRTDTLTTYSDVALQDTLDLAVYSTDYTGYVFRGWSIDNLDETSDVDITITATYAKESVVLVNLIDETYKYTGYSDVSLEETLDTSVTSHAYNYYYLDAENNPVEINLSTFMPTEDIVIYAETYSVDYIVFEHGQIVSTLSNKYYAGETATLNYTQSSGLEFVGYYKSITTDAYGVVTFSNRVDSIGGQAATIYVRYAKPCTINYTIDFGDDTGGSGTISTYSDVSFAEAFGEMKHESSGKRLIDYLPSDIDINSLVKTDREIIIDIKTYYDVTYYIVKDGSIVDKQIVTYSDLLMQYPGDNLTSPAFEGYELVGYYTELDFVNQVDWPAYTLPSTMYVRYAKPCTINYTIDYGEAGGDSGTISTYSDVSFAEAFGEMKHESSGKRLVDYLPSDIDINSLVKTDREIIIDMKTYYDVTYYIVKDGSIVDKQIVTYDEQTMYSPGNDVSKPTYEGYELVGYYTELDFVEDNELQNYSQYGLPSTIYVRYAKPVTLTIEVDHGNAGIDSVHLSIYSDVSFETAISEYNSSYVEYFTNSMYCDNPIVATNKVLKSQLISARAFRLINVTFTIVEEGVTKFSYVDSIIENTMMQNISEVAYTPSGSAEFIGYYTDAEFTNKIDPTVMLYQYDADNDYRLTLYARYTTKYNIDVYVQGNGSYAETLTLYLDTDANTNGVVTYEEVYNKLIEKGYTIYENQLYKDSICVDSVSLSSELTGYISETGVYEVSFYTEDPNDYIQIYIDNELSDTIAYRPGYDWVSPQGFGFSDDYDWYINGTLTSHDSADYIYEGDSVQGYSKITVNVNEEEYGNWYKAQTIQENLDRFGFKYSESYRITNITTGTVVALTDKLSADATIVIDVPYSFAAHVNLTTGKADLDSTIYVPVTQNGILTLNDVITAYSFLSDTARNCGLYKDANMAEVFSSTDLNTSYNVADGDELPIIYTKPATTEINTAPTGVPNYYEPFTFTEYSTYATVSINYQGGTYYARVNNDLVIPATYNGLPVTKITNVIDTQGESEDTDTYTIYVPYTVTEINGVMSNNVAGVYLLGGNKYSISRTGTEWISDGRDWMDYENDFDTTVTVQRTVVSGVKLVLNVPHYYHTEVYSPGSSAVTEITSVVIKKIS